MTAEEFRRYYHYSPRNGSITYTFISERGIFSSGVQVGRISAKDGYRYVCIDKRKIKASHLAYLYMTGSFPKKSEYMLHLNGRRWDTRWENLQCLPVRSKAQSPIKQINTRFHKKTKLWQAVAEIKFNYAFPELFESQEQAIAAFCGKKIVVSVDVIDTHVKENNHETI